MFIFPYNRDNQVRNIPWVVVGLMVLNTLLLILSWLGPSSEAFFRTYGFTPAHAQLYTVFSSMFLHAGFWHLFGNMWFLWMFGNRVENTVGPWLFSLVYLACGFGGDVLHYFFNSASAIPCVGASGAISGIVGCFFVLFPKANFDLVIYFRWTTLKTIHTHTHAAIGAWVAEQTLLGLLTQALHASSVAFWAHVGGFAVGLAAGGIAVLLIPKKKRLALDRAKPWFQQDRFNRDRDDFIQLKL
jgi:membrane associated rhomboid family serine protease